MRQIKRPPPAKTSRSATLRWHSTMGQAELGGSCAGHGRGQLVDITAHIASPIPAITRIDAAKYHFASHSSRALDET